ncbi:hypothetical protein ACLB2K_053890 [Fragaria x ananassa]
MANFLISRTLNSIRNRNLFTSLASLSRQFSSSASAAAEQPQSDGGEGSTFTFSSDGGQELKPNHDDSIQIKPNSSSKRETASSSVTMPMSFMMGSVVGKRFYNQVTTRKADDGNGWTAIAAEWEFQETDGIRLFMMPLMKLACTALERVPITRHKNGKWKRLIHYLIGWSLNLALSLSFTPAFSVESMMRDF